MKNSIELDIINWLKLLKDLNKSKLVNKKYISKKNYLLFFVFFKYLILKDFCLINYKILFINYKIYLYINKFECRFYYLFFFILLRNKLYEFIDFTLFSLIIKENIDNINIENKINNLLHLYKYNNYIFLYIYLIRYIYKFIIKYNKFIYYKNVKIENKIFFFKEFILKIDYNSYFLYRKYIEFFRLFKYNEYLSNNKLFWKYPKLKKIFHISSFNKNNLIFSFRKNSLIHAFFIYKIKIFKNISNNHIIHFFINKKRKYDYSFHYLKLINLLNNKFINFNYIYITNKFINKNYIKFLDLSNSYLYLQFIKNFNPFISIYLTNICYKVYNNNIFLLKKRKLLKLRHFSSIYWKYNTTKFKFSSYILKFFYKFFSKNLFKTINTINYSFISYFFYDNNIYIKNYIKKNILIYRITNILIIDYISLLLNHIYYDIDIEAHKFKNFGQPDFLKLWKKNYIKYTKNKQKYSIAPIYNISYRNVFYKKHSNNIHAFKSSEDLAINILKINFVYFFLWKFIYKWSILLFTDILYFIKKDNNLLDIISNHKFSLECISWEILNSNNNDIKNKKYYFQFNYIIKCVKIENIISTFIVLYTKTILQYISKYPKDYFINISFSYLFLRDFFFRILSKKKKRYYLKKYLKKIWIYKKKNKFIFF